MAIFNYIITCALLEKNDNHHNSNKDKISKPPVTKLNKNKLYSDNIVFKEVQFVKAEKTK